MLRWFYTVLNIKHQYQKVQFSTFLLKNPTYTLCRVIKISASMDWDAFSVQLKNHENWKIFRYPKFKKTGKKSFFSPTSKFIFTLLQPNCWCIRMTFSVNNSKYVHLLHIKLHDIQSTLIYDNLQIR